MSQIDVVQRQSGEVTVLDLKGDLIFGIGNTVLRQSIRSLLSEGKKNVLLNLGETGFLDSSGIGELVSAYIAVKREGGQLKLMNPTHRVQQILAITRLLNVFEIFENELAAINSYHKKPLQKSEISAEFRL